MFDVLPTFLCQVCGWIAGTTETDEIYCSNPKCAQRGKLYKVEVIVKEIENGRVV